MTRQFSHYDLNIPPWLITVIVIGRKTPIYLTNYYDPNTVETNAYRFWNDTQYENFRGIMIRFLKPKDKRSVKTMKKWEREKSDLPCYAGCRSGFRRLFAACREDCWHDKKKMIKKRESHFSQFLTVHLLFKCRFVESLVECWRYTSSQ